MQRPVSSSGTLPDTYCSLLIVLEQGKFYLKHPAQYIDMPVKFKSVDELSQGRIYEGLIALVAGVYALSIGGYAFLANTMFAGSPSTALTPGATAMFSLTIGTGLIIVIHGVLLFTDFDAKFAKYSGPLMILYAFLMILDQAVSPAAGFGAGMIAFALLMVFTGMMMMHNEGAIEELM
jgi:hypothetical protein